MHWDLTVAPHAAWSSEATSGTTFFSRDKNPEERRLILKRGDKILKNVKMRGKYNVPDVAKVRDRKPGLCVVGARLAGVMAGPRWLLRVLPPFLAQAPSQLLPGRYLSWLWLYSVVVSDK